MEALHSMWRHKAKGNAWARPFGWWRTASEKIISVTVLEKSNHLSDLPAQVRQLKFWVHSHHVYNLFLFLAPKLELNFSINSTCLCSCSGLFSLFWHTQLKVEPIIISAANYGFGIYLEVFCKKNIARLKRKSGRNMLGSECVQVHVNDIIEDSVPRSQFSAINIIKLLFVQLTSARLNTANVLFPKVTRVSAEWKIKLSIFIQNNITDINLGFHNMP